MVAIKFPEQDGMPEEWRVTRLCDVAETRKETVDPRNGKYRYVGLEHIDPGVPQLKRCGYSDEVRSAKSKFYSGDILYGKLRPYLDKCVLINFKGISSTDIIVIKTNDDVSNKFLSYFMHTNNFREYATKTMTGVNHPRTSWRALSHFSIPLPPLPEQHRIAAVLSAAQDAKENTGAVIAAAKSLKKSLMRHLFTYGPVSTGAAESAVLAETEIGLVPEGWEVVRLGDYLDVLRNGITKKQNKDGKGIPVSRIETISTSEINPQKVGYIVGLSDDEIEKYKLIGGDILFSHINSEPYLGNSAIYETEPKILIHGMNLLLFRTKSDLLNSKFLNYLFNYYRQKQTFIGTASRSVNQSSINQGKIKALQIPLPPLPTQKKITNIPSTVDKKIETEENKKIALDELFKSLLHNLMTAKIRVNHLEMTQ